MKKKLQSSSSSTSFSFVVTQLYNISEELRASVIGREQNCSSITKQFCNKKCYNRSSK
jgi:hypothetical protein